MHDHGTATKITETGRVEASTHADAPIQIPYDLPDASPDVATNYLLSRVIVVHIRATNELTSMHYLHSYMTKRELPHYHALQFLPDGPFLQLVLLLWWCHLTILHVAIDAIQRLLNSTV